MTNNLTMRNDGIKEVTYKVSAQVEANRFVAIDGNAEVAHDADLSSVANVGATTRQGTVAEGYAPVKSMGYATVEASGAITAGTELTSDANGKAKAAVTTNTVVALAVTSTTVDTELMEVKLVTPYVK